MHSLDQRIAGVEPHCLDVVAKLDEETPRRLLELFHYAASGDGYLDQELLGDDELQEKLDEVLE